MTATKTMSGSVSDQVSDAAREVLAHGRAVERARQIRERNDAAAMGLVRRAEELEAKISEHELVKLQAELREVRGQLQSLTEQTARDEGNAEQAVVAAVPVSLRRLIQRLNERHDKLRMADADAAVIRENQATLDARAAAMAMMHKTFSPEELDSRIVELSRAGGLI